jgi:hypothetical protein
MYWKIFWPLTITIATLILGAAAAKDEQMPHVGDVLVPKKPGTEIATVSLHVPAPPHGGHFPLKICTDHGQHILEKLEVTPSGTSHPVLLMTGVHVDQTGVYGWTLSNYSVHIRCEMDHDIIFFVVAGPNYEDGTASAILDAIQKAWNER